MRSYIGSCKHSAKAEGGFVLIVALILLLVLTILGLAAAMSSSLEERMAGNARNHDLAFQSAEAGLTAADSGILQGLWTNVDYAGNAGGLYMTSTCCSSTGGSWTSAWTMPSVWSTALTITTPVAGLTIPNVSSQPVFVIEQLPAVVPPGSNLSGAQYGGGGSPQAQPYRITVYAAGGDPTSHVILQTVVTQ